MWPQSCDQTNPVHRLVSQTLRLVLSLCSIVGIHTGLFHVPEDRELIWETAVHLTAHYKWLAKWAPYQGLKRWHRVLKHHYVGHLTLPHALMSLVCPMALCISHGCRPSQLSHVPLRHFCKTMAVVCTKPPLLAFCDTCLMRPMKPSSK